MRSRSPPAGRSCAGSCALLELPDADVIVVGAGAAGCVAAATAVELGCSVAVFEAGPEGPLPPALRSTDLTRAAEVEDWWWPGPYPSGRGLGGGTAVNGMVVQRPRTSWLAEFEWAWEALNPVPAEPGTLAQTLMWSVEGVDGVTTEVAHLSVRNGQRQTAADVWLGPADRLAVLPRTTVAADDVARWCAEGRSVLVAGGALRSPDLVGVAGAEPRDHSSAVVRFRLPSHLRTGGRDQPAATALIRRADAQLLVMDHTDAQHEWGALVVSAMVEDPDARVLGAGVALALDVLADVGVEGEVQDGSAPVAHACCTLTGVDTIAPVVDASTLPGLPDVNPLLTVAAHARKQTLRALDL